MFIFYEITMKITICSSVDFTPAIIEIKNDLEKMGHTVNIPYMTQKILNGEISYEEYMYSKIKDRGDIIMRDKEAVDMIKRYRDFIIDSDAILVVNLEKKGIAWYIWGNSLIEMWFAYGHGKRIFLYNSIPERWEIIHYVDEILDMTPIIINKNLKKII